MKVYKYHIGYEVNTGTESEPHCETFYTGKTTTDEEIAKREAYTGLYKIIDDGKPDPTETPTQLDILEAKLTYLEIMTGFYEEA